MHIFITGGSGQTGPAIVSELIAHGHMVTGLARSKTSMNRLAELGAQTLHGLLTTWKYWRKARELLMESFTWRSAGTSRIPQA